MLAKLLQNEELLLISPELAAQLQSRPGEQRNLSTSSFRPPGGPTPSRGFFLSQTFRRPGGVSRIRAPCRRLSSQDGSFAPCACWPETSAGPRRRSRSSRSPAGAAGSCVIERYPSAGYAHARGDRRGVPVSPRRSSPAAAGFGVAGPVRDGKSRITNLPWRLDEAKLSRRIGIRRVALVNDFVANALGLRYLGPRQVATLCARAPGDGRPVAHPRRRHGSRTGRRPAGRGPTTIVVASEGGHVDFGPRTAQRGPSRRTSSARASAGPRASASSPAAGSSSSTSSSRPTAPPARTAAVRPSSPRPTTGRPSSAASGSRGGTASAAPPSTSSSRSTARRRATSPCSTGPPGGVYVAGGIAREDPAGDEAPRVSCARSTTSRRCGSCSAGSRCASSSIRTSASTARRPPPRLFRRSIETTLAFLG